MDWSHRNAIFQNLLNSIIFLKPLTINIILVNLLLTNESTNLIINILIQRGGGTWPFETSATGSIVEYCATSSRCKPDR